MKRKIVADSSSDMLILDGLDFESVPLKIRTTEKEYIDDGHLDSMQMLDELKKYKGKSKSSCPNPDDFLSAFEGADEVFCITITSGLSGSRKGVERISPTAITFRLFCRISPSKVLLDFVKIRQNQSKTYSPYGA